ncbi:Major royal jelly protein 1, partial [Cyphomyrmex costatus]
GAHSPYPGGSHATASQSAGCAAVRKEFARAGLIREPGSPGTSTLPYNPLHPPLTLRSFRKPAARRYPLTDPSRLLAPPLPLPHTTRTSLLLEPPSSTAPQLFRDGVCFCTIRATLFDCSRTRQSVRGTAYDIDECNRLWVVDSGRVMMKAVCPTKILIFDLATDQLIHKYVVPDDQVLYGKAGLVTPIVDVGKTCLDTYLYVADVDQNGLVIYDLYRDYSWRVNNTRGNAFGPDEDAMNITIAGEWFDLTDGTLGMSLSPFGYFNHRYLYFNSLASYYQKYTDTFSLKQSKFREPVIFQSNYKRASQAGVQATSRRGVIFFQLVQLTAIACWDIGKPFTPENVVIIAQDEETLQYVSGIKVITNRAGEEELWFNTNRLQKTINMSLKPTEINFRLIRGKVDDIIRGTNCEPSGVRTATPDTVFWHQI